MNYQDFIRSLNKTISGYDVTSQIYENGHFFQECSDNTILIDRVESDFSTLEEASEYIRQEQIREDIQKKISKETYETISLYKVADIIRECHGDIRITDTLIESYIDSASSNVFSVDPVVLELRSFNPIRPFENHIDFILNDGTTIAITEEKIKDINNKFGEHKDIIDYMSESIDNFMFTLKQMEQ